MDIEWTVTVPDGYEAVATDGTLEAKPIERPLPAPLVVAGVLYELGGGVHEPGFMTGRQISSLSGGKPTFQQKGFGVFSPQDDSRSLTQDNMISELEPGAVRR